MTEQDSQGKNGCDWKKVVGAILLLILAVAIVFAISNNSQSLNVAVGILTVIIAFVAIYMGLITWMSKREWDAFEKKTEDKVEKINTNWDKFEKKQIPIIEKLQKDQDELMKISKLKDKVLPTDPYLRKDESQEVIDSITAHYNKDQDDEAWEMYGVGRSFDMKKNYKIAIEYYNIALGKGFTDSNLKLHIHQSLGIDYFWWGRQCEANDKNADAIKYYMEAICWYEKVTNYNPQFEDAKNNKAITLIQLGKIEGVKPKPYDDASYCLNEAIIILKNLKDDYDHLYDKARALALLNQKDEAIKSLTRAFKLAELAGLGNQLYKEHLKGDLKDFKNIEGGAEFQALLEQYRDFNKGNN